jgi:hypothetical protein
LSNVSFHEASAVGRIRTLTATSGLYTMSNTRRHLSVNRPLDAIFQMLDAHCTVIVSIVFGSAIDIQWLHYGSEMVILAGLL